MLKTRHGAIIGTTPLVVSIQRASEELDCSIDTIKRLIAAGKLRKVQVSARKVAVTYSSILELVGEAA